MKKIFLCFLTLFLSAPVLAATHSKPVSTKTSNDRIILYAAPQSKTVLERVPGDAALIPIYRQKAWVKVGDPRNGRVGWVNKKQMRKAREAFFRPDIQMIYIHTDRNKNGKPQLHIVAYQNGKKVSPEQAKRMYDRMRKNQIREMRRMRHMTGWVGDAPFIDMEPGFQPMFVLPASQPQPKK